MAGSEDPRRERGPETDDSRQAFYGGVNELENEGIFDTVVLYEYLICSSLILLSGRMFPVAFVVYGRGR